MRCWVGWVAVAVAVVVVAVLGVSYGCVYSRARVPHWRRARLRLRDRRRPRRRLGCGAGWRQGGVRRSLEERCAHVDARAACHGAAQANQ